MKVKATKTKKECTQDCWFATTNICRCSCRGANHAIERHLEAAEIAERVQEADAEFERKEKAEEQFYAGFEKIH